MRRWIRARRQRGQVLIIIAVALVGLLALAGLAIDGGNLFMKRRRAQNAADAAALAGTRWLARAMMTCGEISYSGLDSVIAQAVNEYAEGNGISDTDGIPGNAVNDNIVAYYVDPSETRLGQVGGGTVDPDTSGVEVEVVDQHRTYFLVVVGIRHIPSSAQAMAMAGRVRQLNGGAPLLPIGVPQLVVHEVEDYTKEHGGDPPDWEMHDTGDGEFCYATEGGGEICPEDPETPQNATRGWLNLNHIFNGDEDKISARDVYNRTYEQSLGDDPCQDAPKLPGLVGWASGECMERTPPIIAGESCHGIEGKDQPCGPKEKYVDGDFIHGISGSRTAPLKAIYEGYECKRVFAPVFDRVYTREEMVEIFSEDEGEQAASPTVYAYWDYGQAFPDDVDWPNGGGFSSGGGGSGNSWYYHIVGYVGVVVPCGTANNHILYGDFAIKSIQTGTLAPESVGGTCSLLVHGVTLWR